MGYQEQADFDRASGADEEERERAQGGGPWERDCLRWCGRVLVGEHGHYCPDYDELPVDETCAEWPCPCSVGDVARKPVDPETAGTNSEGR